MTDFFADLERELRKAHRRDAAQPRRLPRPNLRPLLAAALVALLVAVVTTATRQSESERAVSPPTRDTVSAPSCDAFEPPVVEEQIPRELAERMAIFRTDNRSAPLPYVPTEFGQQAKRLYAGAVRVRASTDYGPGPIKGWVVAADVIRAAQRPDLCAPPPDETEPGVCIMVKPPEGSAGCFTVEEVMAADAFITLGRRAVLGVAPDGAKRVIFDAGQPTGPVRLKVVENGFADSQMYIYPATSPEQVDTRFGY